VFLLALFTIGKDSCENLTLFLFLFPIGAFEFRDRSEFSNLYVSLFDENVRPYLTFGYSNLAISPVSFLGSARIKEGRPLFLLTS
jgi:hypothetical protein